MNTTNTATIAAVVPNTFDMHDKAMDIVTAVLGEELSDVYNIAISGNTCKIFFPLNVSLAALSGRDDVTVNFVGNNSSILVH